MCPVRPARYFCPVIHQPTPTLEQVGASVRGLDLVLHHMRQRCLDDLPGVIRLVGRPIPERRPEPVRHGRDLFCWSNWRSWGVGEGLPGLSGEDQPSAATA